MALVVVVMSAAMRAAWRASGAPAGGPRVMRAIAIAAYLFLYAPIALVVLFSFNAGRNASEFTGFSVAGTRRRCRTGSLSRRCRTASSLPSSAPALRRYSEPWPRSAWSGSARAAPGLRRAVCRGHRGARRRHRNCYAGRAGAAPRLFNPVIAAFAGRVAAAAQPRLRIDHRGARAFSLALVTLIVRARIATLSRDIVEASSDLYATPATTFRRIISAADIPLDPGGFLLSFTFSFDDFIIAFFVAGTQTTLPIYVFASIRRGGDAEINAIATMILIASFMLIAFARILMRERKPLKTGDTQ